MLIFRFTGDACLGEGICDSWLGSWRLLALGDLVRWAVVGGSIGISVRRLLRFLLQNGVSALWRHMSIFEPRNILRIDHVDLHALNDSGHRAEEKRR